ncbi:MAG: AAA family ATPase, partial [Acidimicrobiales bacterium]
MTRGLLLERDAERQRMAGALAEARAGRGSVLIVHGPAGIGKSSLLGAGIDDAHDLGFLVARAVGSELETELALGVARTLAAALVAGAGDVDLGGSAARAHLLTQPTGKPTDAWAAIDGLHWLLARVAEHQPVLVVVDDAHVADPPSQRALGYLAARVADAAVVLAVAVRTGSGGTTPIAERLLDLPDAIGIRPKSLSHRAVRLLVEHYLGTPASDSFVEACRDATRGNPFLLNALLGELGAEEATPDDEHAARVARLAPPGVLRSIVLRLNRLGPDATATAHALAVLGDAQPLPLLAQVSDLPVGVVEAAIDALVGADLVAQASGQAPVFAHPVVRSTLARAIAGSARVTLHERAAAALT